MTCRVCLEKDMQVYYKINTIYIELIKKLTNVKMTANDIVCCFCLGVLRKIQKFSDTVKEVDSILKLSIKIEDAKVYKFYDLAVSETKNISVGCSTAMFDISSDQLLKNIDTEMLKIEEESYHSSEEINIKNIRDLEDEAQLILPDTRSERKELLNKSEETRHSSGDVINIKTETEVPLTTSTIQGMRCDGQLNEYTEFDFNISFIDLCYMIRQRIKSNTIHHKRFANQNIKTETEVPLTTIQDIGSYSQVNEYAEFGQFWSQNSTSFLSEENEDMMINEDVSTQNIDIKKIRKGIEKCKQNYKVSVNKFNKQNYVERIDNSGTLFPCDKCDFISKTINILTQHVKIIHQSENLFACKFCSLKFERKNALNFHLATHSKKKPFSCDKCGYRSRYHTALSKHLTKPCTGKDT